MIRYWRYGWVAIMESSNEHDLINGAIEEVECSSSNGLWGSEFETKRFNGCDNDVNNEKK